MLIEILEMKRSASSTEDGWLFPANTKSGHIEPSTLKKQEPADANDVIGFGDDGGRLGTRTPDLLGVNQTL